MATASTLQDQQPPFPPETGLRELRIYSHSTLFYWWPVWVTGFIMAFVTYLGGRQVAVGNALEWYHPGPNVGLIFTMVLFLTVLITNVTFRGLSSVVVVLAIVLVTVVLAYFGWWEEIIRWLPAFSVHMNLGFYLLFSTLIFVLWVLATFVYDRFSYWTVRPGQMTHNYVLGGAERSYDTQGMVFEKIRQDLFRHWLLGFGSGDLRISTMGAKREEIYVPNVLFVESKVQLIQRMIAVRPNQFATPAV